MPNARETVLRWAEQQDVKGRTIEGKALPWGVWTPVADLDGSRYDENHLDTSMDESLRRNGHERPLFSNHDGLLGRPPGDPIGVAHFEKSAAEHALMYRAYLNATRKADAQLAMVRDGSKRNVSVAFDPLQWKNVRRARGIGRLRVESRLRELSLVALGQYPDALITSVRSRGTTRPRPCAPLEERLAASLAARHRARATDWKVVKCGGLSMAEYDRTWESFIADYGPFPQ